MADVFCQTFTAGIPGLGEMISIPLVEGGDEIMVTEDNRRDYVELYIAFVLNTSIHKQARSPFWPSGQLHERLELQLVL